MTVYVPILTFQRIEGKLFRPMALTISLAVIGSLLLTLTVIPVLSQPVLPPPAHRAREPAAALGAAAVHCPPCAGALRRPARTGRVRGGRAGGRAGRLHAARQGVPARAGRGRSVGAHAVPDRHLGRGGAALHPRDPRAAAEVPRGAGGRLPARRPGRRHRSRGPRQRRVLRGPQATRGVGESGQGRAHRVHAGRAGRPAGIHDELLAADQGQRGRGPGRREG